MSRQKPKIQRKRARSQGQQIHQRSLTMTRTDGAGGVDAGGAADGAGETKTRPIRVPSRTCQDLESNPLSR